MSKLITCAFAIAAIALFKEHSKLAEVHVTSDGQGFTDKDKAENQSRYLKDKEIKHFQRGFEADYSEEELGGTGGGIEPGAAERNKAVSDYMEVFGKTPNHNMLTENIIKATEGKKASLVKDQGAGANNPPATNENGKDQEGEQ